MTNNDDDDNDINNWEMLLYWGAMDSGLGGKLPKQNRTLI